MSAISAGWLYVGWGAVNFETNYGLMQQSPSEIKEKLLKALDKEYNVVDMAVVLEIVSILEKTPITKEALEWSKCCAPELVFLNQNISPSTKTPDKPTITRMNLCYGFQQVEKFTTTRLGKYINELRRKTTNESLAKRAKDLVRRWRDMILPQTELPTPVSHQHNGSTRIPSVGVSNRSGSGTASVRPNVMSPAMSLPSNNTSPALSIPSRGEAVPKTHAANKRLRKETSSPDKPPVKVPRLNGSTFRPDPGECSRDSSDRASDGCEIISVVRHTDEEALDPKKRGRKKGSRNRTSLSKENSQNKSSDDIVKEKIASIARTPRVKTTKELLADLRSKSGDILPAENQASLANCILPGADEMTRNKSEHIAKFLRSQSELENDDSIEILKTSREELRPSSESLPSHSSHGPAQTSTTSSIIAPSPAPEELPERTVEDILARLPPLDIDAIHWEDSQSPPGSPPHCIEITEDDVFRLHNEHIEGLNGCYDHSVTQNSGEEGRGNFREWHEMVSRTSYNGELLHILPYVVID